MISLISENCVGVRVQLPTRWRPAIILVMAFPWAWIARDAASTAVKGGGSLEYWTIAAVGALLTIAIVAVAAREARYQNRSPPPSAVSVGQRVTGNGT